MEVFRDFEETIGFIYMLDYMKTMGLLKECMLRGGISQMEMVFIMTEK